VEVSSRCNINCIMCRDRDGSVMVPQKAGSAAGFMEFELFRKLRPLLAGTFTVNLFGWGEPMLHKDFLRFIEFTRECNPHCEITFNTNGTLLTERKAARLVELDVTRICFSIDSPDPDTYEKIRRGAKFHKVIANIERLGELRGEHPVLAMEQVLMQPNVGQLPQTVELAHRLGIGEIYLEQLFGPFPDLILEDLAPHLDSYRAARKMALALDVSLAGPMVGQFEQLRMGKTDPPPATADAPRPAHLPAARCPEPWQTIFVDRTGNVIPCCFQQFNTALGRIPEMTPEQVWFGEGYRKLRRGVVDEPYYPGCENCIANGLPPGPLLSSGWMNSVESAPPGGAPVEIPPPPRPEPWGMKRIARALQRRLPGGGGKREEEKP